MAELEQVSVDTAAPPSGATPAAAVATPDASPSGGDAPKGLSAHIDAAIQKFDPEQPEKPAGAKDRDPATGRFAKNTEPAAGDKTASVGDVKPDEAAKVEPAAVQHLDPPARWSEKQKAEFAKLQPEAQALLLEQSKAADAHFTQESQRLAETRKPIEKLIDVLKPYETYFRQINGTPETAIPALLNAEAQLRFGTPEQKLHLFASLARDYGVDLSVFTGGQQQPADPAYQQLRRDLALAQQQISQLTQVHEQTFTQSLQQQIDSFAAEKAQDGMTKYPYFETVKFKMGELLASGDVQTLPDAYAKAVEPLNAHIAAELTKRQNDQNQQNKAAIDKARAAAPVKHSGAMNGQTQPKGLDAILNARIAAAGIS